MRPACLIAFVALLPTSGHAAGDGVFCRGTMSFIARPEASGALAFKVMGSTQQQNIIELGGIALPHAGGWRYQVKSASTPEHRCTLDIKAAGGGYHLGTVAGAECESSGGIGASALIGNATFPDSARLAGVAPPGGKPEDFPAVDCKHKRLYSSSEPAMTCAVPVLGAAPVSVVRGLIAQDTGGWSKIFDNKPTAVMRQYFTEGFNASWAKATTHNQDEPVLDGDPITGYQMVERVQEVSTIGGETSSTTAKVIARLKVSYGGKTEPE